MKLYRYMSMEEFNAMSIGMDIVGINDFSANATTSTGVCFLGENTHFEIILDNGEVIGRDYSPEACYAFLNGIVSNDVLVEFVTTDAVTVTPSTGKYANPCSGIWDDTIIITEYCMPKYNRDTLIPVAYTVDVDSSSTDWTWFDYH